MANVLVPFSGGVDSFYVALTESGIKGNKVYLCYNTLTNNYTKYPVERALAKAHSRYLFKQGYVFDLPDLEINASEMVGVYDCLQFVLWMVLSNRGSTEYDYIAPGTIMGDDIVSFKEEFDNLMRALNALSSKPIKNGIKWDYTKITKRMIYRHLQADGIYPGTEPWENFWTCELPKRLPYTDGNDYPLKSMDLRPNPHISGLYTIVNNNTLMYDTGELGIDGENEYVVYQECGVCLKCREAAIMRNPNPPSQLLPPNVSSPSGSSFQDEASGD